jgi:hypothetical protein
VLLPAPIQFGNILRRQLQLSLTFGIREALSKRHRELGALARRKLQKFRK